MSKPFGIICRTFHTHNEASLNSPTLHGDAHHVVYCVRCERYAFKEEVNGGYDGSSTYYDLITDQSLIMKLDSREKVVSYLRQKELQLHEILDGQKVR